MYSLNRAGWYIDIKINIVIHSLLFTCATDLVFPDRSILARLAMTDGTNANARMQLLPPPPYPPPHPTASLPGIGSICFGHKNTLTSDHDKRS